MIDQLGSDARPDAPVATDEARRARIVVHALDGFATAHSASLEAVQGRVPSDALHPVRLPDGRALVSLSFYRKHGIMAVTGDESTALPPYAELVVSAMVTRRPLPRLVAALALNGLVRRRIGAVPLAFPLTHPLFRDVIKASLGLPVFLADFELDLSAPEWRLAISDGSPLITVTVKPRGRVSFFDQPTALYGVVEGRLVAARCEQTGIVQRRLGGATCELAYRHPSIAGLEELHISPRAVATVVYRSGRVDLWPARDVGPGRPIDPIEGLGSAGGLTVRP